MKLLGVAGSLRRGSVNRALLVAASGLLPEGVELQIAPIGDSPLYNGDLDDDEQRPAAVEAFKQAVADADVVLIATPEFNYGIPGVLKNAIDWASRPAYRSVFAGKPVAIISASPSPVGGVRAQGPLKQVLLGMLSEVFPYPEFSVPGAFGKFEDGRLTDDKTRERLIKMLAALQQWVQRRA